MVVACIILRHGGGGEGLILRLWNLVVGYNILWVNTLGALPSLSHTKRKKERVYLRCPGKAGGFIKLSFKIRKVMSSESSQTRVRVKFGSF